GMISSIMLPLGMIGFGPLADVVKIEWLLLFTGILIMGVTYFFISDKVLVRAGIPLTPKSPQQE
ncbi:MAG TPA: MFS transporter, partial [Porphyromonadaceae bacterium]|nr:MFS transporter [Porphyromonadaceae bacterium]